VSGSDAKRFTERSMADFYNRIQMTKTQLILLNGGSDGLKAKIAKDGPIALPGTPPVVLSLPPRITAEAGLVRLREAVVESIARNSIAIACAYDTDVIAGEAVKHQLEVVAITFQLVKPTVQFLNLWLQLDGNNLTERVARPVSDLDRSFPESYLQYQQHNVITEPDVQRAASLITRLSMALDPVNGSWNHPLLPIHRALMFFCQGYSVIPPTPNQFLWAAGLDCLYASKLDRKKQGSAEITRRMGILLGSTLKLYEADTVSIPVHQTTRTHMELGNVARDIFRLRNAFAHGLPIPNTAWLSVNGQPLESGYAYQLLEQTEISLRLTLLRILENQSLFDTFSDSGLLDSYF
jgi:hypothetical protein